MLLDGSETPGFPSSLYQNQKNASLVIFWLNENLNFPFQLCWHGSMFFSECLVWYSGYFLKVFCFARQPLYFLAKVEVFVQNVLLSKFLYAPMCCHIASLFNIESGILKQKKNSGNSLLCYSLGYKVPSWSPLLSPFLESCNICFIHKVQGFICN